MGFFGSTTSPTSDPAQVIPVVGSILGASGSSFKTALQIHDFLKQAKEALLSGDVDGANTLARKAKVLLTELTQ